MNRATDGTSYSDLPERSRQILAGLVQQYIDQGEPVSSLWLAQHGGFGWSSATVRSVMAKLEEEGYVHQPYTSAGRVPTDRGYRAYVDLLLDARQAANNAPDVEGASPPGRYRERRALERVPRALARLASSRIRHDAAHRGHPTTDRVRTARGTRILVVVETDEGTVEHKVIELGERVDTTELQHGANYLNAEFTGLPLWNVRAAVTERLRQQRMLYDQLLSRALRLASSTLEDMVPPNSLFLEGAGFLLDEAIQDDHEKHVPLATLRALLTMIERKDQLVRLLSEYIDGQGLTVVIGTEHLSPEMQDFSLVMSTYIDGDRTGSVGVIGPRRMRYSRAIAAVDSMSCAVTRVLVGHVPRRAN